MWRDHPAKGRAEDTAFTNLPHPCRTRELGVLVPSFQMEKWAQTGVSDPSRAGPGGNCSPCPVPGAAFCPGRGGQEGAKGELGVPGKGAGSAGPGEADSEQQGGPVAPAKVSAERRPGLGSGKGHTLQAKGDR